MIDGGVTGLDKLQAGQFWCRTCGAAHKGMFDLAAYAPEAWPGSRDYEPIGDLTFERSFLSEDFAFHEGGYFFLRCVLHIPVHGLPRPFGFGCWTIVSHADFMAYWNDFDNPDPAPAQPWLGRLANDLKPFPTSTNLECAVQIQPNRKRPEVELCDDGHPLARAQQGGITADRLLALYRANGHDIG